MSQSMCVVGLRQAVVLLVEVNGRTANSSAERPMYGSPFNNNLQFLSNTNPTFIIKSIHHCRIVSGYQIKQPMPIRTYLEQWIFRLK